MDLEVPYFHRNSYVSDICKLFWGQVSWFNITDIDIQCFHRFCCTKLTRHWLLQLTITYPFWLGLPQPWLGRPGLCVDLTAITKASCGLEKRPACEKSSCSVILLPPVGYFGILYLVENSRYENRSPCSDQEAIPGFVMGTVTNVPPEFWTTKQWLVQGGS